MERLLSMRDVRAVMLAIAKNNWVRLLLRGALYRDKFDRFDMAYDVSDPWRMRSEQEQHRFAETNRIILEQMGKPNSILEIGCGEGHQTSHLQKLCGKVHGFDVSAKAVERAMQRCPGAKLCVSNLFSYEAQDKKFDLVIACEVLYYFRDVAAALRRMGELGHWKLVSYYGPEAPRLDPLFTNIPDSQRRIIQYGPVSWTAVWWK
jgi:SAM-dependent methyltransferase